MSGPSNGMTASLTSPLQTNFDWAAALGRGDWDSMANVAVTRLQAAGVPPEAVSGLGLLLNGTEADHGFWHKVLARCGTEDALIAYLKAVGLMADRRSQAEHDGTHTAGGALAKRCAEVLRIQSNANRPEHNPSLPCFHAEASTQLNIPPVYGRQSWPTPPRQRCGQVDADVIQALSGNVERPLGAVRDHGWSKSELARAADALLVAVNAWTTPGTCADAFVALKWASMSGSGCALEDIPEPSSVSLRSSTLTTQNQQFDEDFDQDFILAWWHRIFASLTERQRRIWSSYTLPSMLNQTGLGGEAPEQQDIAKVLGVSVQTISAEHRRILDDLRQSLPADMSTRLAVLRMLTTTGMTAVTAPLAHRTT